jgi:hypothetical protein
MTTHRAGRTNTRNPNSWHAGKKCKTDTARLLRRRAKEISRRWMLGKEDT